MAHVLPAYCLDQPLASERVRWCEKNVQTPSICTQERMQLHLCNYGDRKMKAIMERVKHYVWLVNGK